MATQYEVEHNIKPSTASNRPGRRVDMTSFDNFLSQLSTGPTTSSTTGRSTPHNNPYAEPTPVDTANLLRLLQDQYAVLLQTATDEENHSFLERLIRDVDTVINGTPKLNSVSQEFLDGLDRVSKKALAGKKGDERCPICYEQFKSDPYPLVVELPCHATHCFDLECVAPWLKTQGTCPTCRKNFVKKKDPQPEPEDDEEDELDAMFA